MWLRELRLGNFKAFAETQRLPIRPITLIFGPNSGGKSSLLHGLILASEAVLSGNCDVNHTWIGGRTLDLGGFRQYVHRGDTERRVQLGIGLDGTRFGRNGDLKGIGKIELFLEIGITHKEAATGAEPLPSGEPRLQRFVLSIDDDDLFSMSRRKGGYFRLDVLRQDHPVLRTIIDASARSSGLTGSADVSELLDRLVPNIVARTTELRMSRSQLNRE